jgi:hypothetical protein
MVGSIVLVALKSGSASSVRIVGGVVEGVGIESTAVGISGGSGVKVGRGMNVIVGSGVWVENEAASVTAELASIAVSLITAAGIKVGSIISRGDWHETDTAVINKNKIRFGFNLVSIHYPQALV